MENPFEIISNRLRNIEVMLLEIKHGSDTMPLYQDKIIEGHVTTRAFKVLMAANIKTWSHLSEFTFKEVTGFRNLGIQSVRELNAALRSRGLKFKGQAY